MIQYRIKQNLPDPHKIKQVIFTNLTEKQSKWHKVYRGHKNDDGRNAGTIGYGFKIEFAEPVRDPTAIGYGAHFGLGLFVPIDNE